MVVHVQISHPNPSRHLNVPTLQTSENMRQPHRALYHDYRDGLVINGSHRLCQGRDIIQRGIDPRDPTYQHSFHNNCKTIRYISLITLLRSLGKNFPSINIYPIAL